MTTAEATKRARASKRKGAQFQSDLRNWLRHDLGFDVEILELSGVEDEGDLVVRLQGGRYVVIEAKNEAKIDLPGYIREAQREAAQFASHRPFVAPDQVTPVAIIKARGKGVARSYAVMDAEDFFREQARS